MDSYRILLYLPFYELNGAPEYFKEAYKNAWYELLHREDVKENFHKGDCFEVDARPNGMIERVVKCAHLTPWLLSTGILTFKEILDVLNTYKNYPVIHQSFRDVWGYIHANKILTHEQVRTLYRETLDTPERMKISPLYTSEKRLKWLNELKSDATLSLLTPNAHLDGPFSPNLKVMSRDIEEIAANLKPSEIVLVGGSRLKGYGVSTSDIDVWKLDDLKTDPTMCPGTPDGIHLYFNSIWIGGSAVGDLSTISKEIVREYSLSDLSTRWKSIEKLESDLLQYRLLHKGFSRFTHKTNFETDPYLEMDGDCPFYDDQYRRLATILFAKYVLIPESGSILPSDRNTERIKSAPFVGGVCVHSYQNTEECKNGKY